MAHPLIITTFIIYFAIVIGIGIWASRSQHDIKDFFLAGRKMRTMVVAFSS